LISIPQLISTILGADQAMTSSNDDYARETGESQPDALFCAAN
jgi:hypothetical protein